MSFNPPNSNTRPAAAAVWQPSAGAHAIQRASAIVTFSEAIPTFAAGKLSSAIRNAARELGMVREEPVHATLVEIRPGAAPRATEAELVGTQFQDIRGTNIAQSVAVTTTGVRFETSVYTRWVAFREQLLALLAPSYPVIEQSVRVGQVALEYVDMFYAINPGPADAQMLLDRKSHLIAARAFSRLGQWHSHCGWFEEETEVKRHLVNTDVTVADATGPVGTRRTISIRTHEAEILLEPQSDRSEYLSQIEPAFACFDKLHVTLKRRLADVLTIDARNMISLGK